MIDKKRRRVGMWHFSGCEKWAIWISKFQKLLGKKMFVTLLVCSLRIKLHFFQLSDIEWIPSIWRFFQLFALFKLPPILVFSKALWDFTSKGVWMIEFSLKSKLKAVKINNSWIDSNKYVLLVNPFEVPWRTRAKIIWRRSGEGSMLSSN